MSARVVELRNGAAWTRYSLAWAPGEALCEDNVGQCYPVPLAVAEQAIDLRAADAAWSELCAAWGRS